MAGLRAAGIIKNAADDRTVAVLEGQGQEEAIAGLAVVGEGSPRDIWHAFAHQSTLIAGLAELVAAQGERIAELEGSTKPAAKKSTAKK